MLNVEENIQHIFPSFNVTFNTSVEIYFRNHDGETLKFIEEFDECKMITLDALAKELNAEAERMYNMCIAPLDYFVNKVVGQPDYFSYTLVTSAHRDDFVFFGKIIKKSDAGE